MWAGGTYNLELVHHIDEITNYNSSSNFGVSDVWGYTDETGIEYAIVGYRYGTYIYDVSSDLDNPQLIIDIVGPSNGDYYFHRDYKIYDHRLYIVNEMSGVDVGMQVIDLSPLPYSVPVKRNTYTGISQSHNLWIDTQTGYGFIEKNYPENVHIIDLSNPDFPLHVSSLSYWDGDNCHDIYTKNNLAYVSEGFSQEFGIYDISDITNPQFLASIPSFGYAHNAWLNESGTHLVTGEETVGMTVKIWDVQDLNNINLVGEYLGENSLAHNVHVKENFVYISHYTTGLKILDIFDPSDPIEVAAYDTYLDDDNNGFYGCWGAYPFTENNFIYASDMQYGLFVLEFDNIKAGWIYGTISNEMGPMQNVQIKSILNEKVFSSNSNGQYEFGYPSGEQEFELYHNESFLGIVTLSIQAHETSEQNIFIGIIGDINGDGSINVLDVISIVNQILSDNYEYSSDLNADGELNILDIINLINIIL